MNAVSHPDIAQMHRLLSRAVDTGILTAREAAQVRAGVWLDDDGEMNMPDDMDRQMAKLFMMEVVPANERPL
jgi:hypothetical protein